MPSAPRATGRGCPPVIRRARRLRAGPTSRGGPSRNSEPTRCRTSGSGREGRGVYLPAHVRAVSLPLSRGEPLRCASLPGLRGELAELAERWELPLDDDGLQDILKVAPRPRRRLRGRCPGDPRLRPARPRRQRGRPPRLPALAGRLSRFAVVVGSSACRGTIGISLKVTSQRILADVIEMRPERAVAGSWV